MGAAMSKKTIDRYNENYELDNLGRLFITPSMAEFDLSGLNILYNSVDTVRQLYKIHLDPDFLIELESKMECDGFHDRIHSINGHKFALKRGGASGYKYILQNNEFGLIILVKHQKTKAECSGSHLKIEVSPKLIAEHSPETLQLLLDNIADVLSLDSNFQPNHVSPHLAIDFQGWEPPIGFEASLTCRSRKVTNRNGLDEIVFDGGLAAVHGRGQSYLFGSASGVQLALYNKTLESKASDKFEYMEECWSRKTKEFDKPLYDPTKPVWRLEVRFHHSVVKQFSDMNIKPPKDVKNSKGKVVKYGDLDINRINSYQLISEHLGGLWRYALNNFRYDLNSLYIHPVWSVFSAESGFDQFQTGFVYRRKYKTAGIGNEKNVAIALGNMISIFARNNTSAGKAYAFIKRSGIYADIKGYFRARGMSHADIFRFIEDGLIQRRLSGKVAA